MRGEVHEVQTGIRRHRIEAADIEIKAMAEDFDGTQLLAIHLKVQCAADQVVGGSFAALFDRIKKIGLHCAHASSAIVYVGRMDQRPFPFQNLRHSLDRQTQQVEEDRYRIGHREFLAEVAMAAVLECRDIFRSEETTSELQY